VKSFPLNSCVGKSHVGSMFAISAPVGVARPENPASMPRTSIIAMKYQYSFMWLSLCSVGMFCSVS